ncbi:DNA/RNA nuclease SfsA [Pseudoalteromonas sp. MMG010]|uniref:DNA/RNA nuclease SfsA n=1 Tax=Pseudoalteromonas sp. MMG010 TaxID=2822685 RepID=UPI001B39DB78|nr:DNA/RNA nuclease SfsA [Pseudoalteromonas sp. MMG010]MBQ4832160.1 DNA/RNA nuclease SfsA [Pseudoalteromonas sp. MMG010]
MLYTPALQSATLIKRYKRFLADLQPEHGAMFTAHCANTGKMTGCAEQGFRAFYSTSDNKKRKYPHSLELTKNHLSHFICVNTAMANKVVEEAISNNIISELTGYQHVQSEVKYGDENSRIDFLLSDPNRANCYVEVKSVTLLSNDAEQGQGYFPDAETVRGQKHIRELISMVELGHRAVLLFAVLHQGIERVACAAHIDPTYNQLLRLAISKGVEVYAYKANITEKEVTLIKKIPFIS